MLTYLEKARPGIVHAVRDILRENESGLVAAGPLGGRLVARLDDYMQGGKMLRGALVRLGYELCGGASPGARLGRVLDRAGGAMEFFQAALLIHDDIMDRDTLRRGRPTMHYRYTGDIRAAGGADPEHHGLSLGICAGDVAFFLGFHTLISLPVPAGLREKARAAAVLAAEELCRVGVAQMEDVHAATQDAAAPDTPERILRLYRYKTARYTFALPLATGALLARANAAAVALLERAGECLGLAFQIKDDDLSVFGRPDASGKGAESDIRENRRTLLRHYLFEAADAGLRSDLDALFGNPELTGRDLERVRQVMESTGARSKARACMERLLDEAARDSELLFAKGLPQDSPARGVFMDLIRYSREREG